MNLRRAKWNKVAPSYSDCPISDNHCFSCFGNELAGPRDTYTGRKLKLLVIFLLFTSLKIAAQNFDIDLLKDINLNRNRSLDGTFESVSNGVSPLIVGVPAYFIVKALVKKDSVNQSRAVFISSSVIVAGIISTSLKYTVQRERPMGRKH